MSTKEVPFGSIEENKIILNPWNDHPSRVIGEIREEGVEYAINYFVEKYEELVKKVDDLEDTINNTENKGSYLQKVRHLRGGLAEYDGLGDFQLLEDRLKGMEDSLEEIVAKNRIRNTEVKKSLIQELAEVVANPDWDETTEAIMDIKTRWIKVGNAVKEEQEALNDKFWGDVQVFYDRKRAFFEDKRRLIKKYEQDYWDLIKESNIVSRLSGPRKTEKIEELKNRWREVGKIPARNYKSLLSKFQANLRRTSAPVDPSRRLQEIEKKLNAIQQGLEPFDSAKADEMRKTLFSIRPRDSKNEQLKKDCLSLLQLLSEMDFVQKLCTKRFSNYNDLGVLEQNELQVNILKELIAKEEQELSQFENNMERFNSRDEGAERMMNRRLSQQKERILIKRRLISILGG